MWHSNVCVTSRNRRGNGNWKSISYGKFVRTGIPFTPLTTIGSAKRQTGIARLGMIH